MENLICIVASQLGICGGTIESIITNFNLFFQSLYSNGAVILFDNIEFSSMNVDNTLCFKFIRDLIQSHASDIRFIIMLSNIEVIKSNNVIDNNTIDNNIIDNNIIENNIIDNNIIDNNVEKLSIFSSPLRSSLSNIKGDKNLKQSFKLLLQPKKDGSFINLINVDDDNQILPIKKITNSPPISLQFSSPVEYVPPSSPNYKKTTSTTAHSSPNNDRDSNKLASLSNYSDNDKRKLLIPSKNNMNLIELKNMNIEDAIILIRKLYYDIKMCHISAQDATMIIKVSKYNIRKMISIINYPLSILSLHM